ncbi:hypothetical protein [Paraflavitalea soli]|uniref:hypothetical protein n=1 Tax=Paraflavitalea soli TaxID=2315862 RepID=UPI0013C47930|nr:hypothetical protein [Paraflavitalea soli]
MKNYSARARKLRLLIYKYAKGTLTIHEKQQLDAYRRNGRSPPSWCWWSQYWPVTWYI